VLGVGVFAALSEDDFEFDGLATSGFGAAVFVEVWFAGGCNSLTVLSLVPDLDLSAGGAAAGDVAGGGVQLGASSGIEGAVADAGTGSSARRKPGEPNNARARPPASAHQRARDARTVDASTGKKSIDFGPAFQTRCETRRGSASSRSSVRRGSRDLGRKDAAETRRASAQGEERLEFAWGRRGAEGLERGVQILRAAKSVKMAQGAF
jgi:hypothetical protein